MSWSRSKRTRTLRPVADYLGGIGRSLKGLRLDEAAFRKTIGDIFSATETAAHARALHHHAVHRQREHVRHDVLHLRRMLSRGTDEDAAVFPAFCPGGVGFEVEVVLTAKGKFTSQPVWRLR